MKNETKYQYCEPERIRALCVPEPLGAAPTEEVAGAAREAGDLARRAYVERDAASIARAERLLYILHANSAFAAPMNPVPAAVWSPLMSQKMRSLELDKGPPLAGHQDLVSALKALTERVDREDNSYIDDIADRTDDLGLVLYTKNWYSSTHGFTTQLVSLIQRAHGKPRLYPLFKALVENLYEEFETVAHPQMRSRWPQRLGIEYSPETAIDDPQQSTEAFSVQNTRTGIQALLEPTYGIGCFFSIEAVFSGICRRIVPVLRKRGIEDHAMQSFLTHMEGDEVHTQELLDAMAACDLSPVDRAGILAGATAQLDARHHMFDAMRRMLVA